MTTFGCKRIPFVCWGQKSVVYQEILETDEIVNLGCCRQQIQDLSRKTTKMGYRTRQGKLETRQCTCTQYILHAPVHDTFRALGTKNAHSISAHLVNTVPQYNFTIVKPYLFLKNNCFNRSDYPMMQEQNQP